MSESSKIGKNLRRFKEAIHRHDEINRTHKAWGIGLSAFDMERLGFEENETLWPGIVVQADGGQSAMCRVLCDGSHAGEGEHVEATVRDAAGVGA